MSDSKGAAIELKQKIHKVVCAYLGLDDESHENDEETAPLEQAILAILAQEVNQARIDELKNIYRHFGKRTVGQVNKFEILDYMENRLDELENGEVK